jgi:hypothetical protein
MLTDEVRARAARQVMNATEGYRQAKASGFNVVALSLPSFETQEDHDLYHPDDAGQDFRDHNEFAAEVLKGLRANVVPAELVTIHYRDYLRWLNGRRNTSEVRSVYGAYLLAEIDRRRTEKR